MPTESDHLNLLQDLVAKAKAAGADAADAVLFNSASLSHAQRLGNLERLEREESKDLGLRVFLGQRQAIVSSTDLAPDTFDEVVERVLAMARAVPEDPYCGLAAPEQLAKDLPSIELSDPDEPDPQTLIERARVCEEAARAVEGVTNSEGAEAGWSRSEIALVTSAGFAGSYQRTSHSLGTSVLAGEGLGMERDYEFSTTVFGEDLEDPAQIGRRAGEKAVKRLNPRKAETGRLPVVFDPRVSRSFLGHLAGAISGPSIARGTSFLKECRDTAVFAAGIRIVDDPHRARGLRSKPFDGEGVANKQTDLVEDGVLKSWILDLSSARQLGLTTTGHASRGTSGPPGPSVTNLYMTPGDLSPADLMADIKQGIYVNEMMGMGVNGVTGDYSRGAGGFWIEDGELADPVTEATVAGNLKEIFRNLTPANDLVFKYGMDAPTLRVEGMTVAGA